MLIYSTITFPEARSFREGGGMVASEGGPAQAPCCRRGGRAASIYARRGQAATARTRLRHLSLLAAARRRAGRRRALLAGDDSSAENHPGSSELPGWWAVRREAWTTTTRNPLSLFLLLSLFLSAADASAWPRNDGACAPQLPGW